MRFFLSENEYIQNDDGSPHDKSRGQKGKIPSWVNTKIKDRTGWDYNGKRDKFFNATKVATTDNGVTKYTFSNGVTVAVWTGNRNAIYANTFEDAYFGSGCTKVNGVTSSGKKIPVLVFPSAPLPSTVSIPIRLPAPVF